MERLYILFYQMSNKGEFTESESISEGIKPAHSSTITVRRKLMHHFESVKSLCCIHSKF